MIGRGQPEFGSMRSGASEFGTEEPLPPSFPQSPKLSKKRSERATIEALRRLTLERPSCDPAEHVDGPLQAVDWSLLHHLWRARGTPYAPLVPTPAAPALPNILIEHAKLTIKAVYRVITVRQNSARKITMNHGVTIPQPEYAACEHPGGSAGQPWPNRVLALPEIDGEALSGRGRDRVACRVAMRRPCRGRRRRPPGRGGAPGWSARARV